MRVGTNTLLGLDPARIADILPALAAGPLALKAPPPGWDGHAADRVADVLCADRDSEDLGAQRQSA